MESLLPSWPVAALTVVLYVVGFLRLISYFPAGPGDVIYPLVVSVFVFVLMPV